MSMLLAGAFSLGEAAIKRLFPDPNKRAEELRKLEEIKSSGDIAKLEQHVSLLLSQLEINKEEAKSGNMFIAGWRPYIGWTGGIALTYQFVLYPILLWIWSSLQVAGTIPTEFNPPPTLDMEILMVLLTGILGIGGMRSFDKSRGIDTNEIRRTK